MHGFVSHYYIIFFVLCQPWLKWVIGCIDKESREWSELWVESVIGYYPGGGGGALTCIGGTGTCRFDDPLFQTLIAALKIPDFQ